MLSSYLKIAKRNLFRHKGYSLINIVGFAVGIASCLLLLIYVYDELSYDRFNQQADNIYRIIVRGRVGGNDFNLSVSCAPIGYTLVEEFPEVVKATRIRNFGFPVIRYEDKVFSEERFYAVDSTFFDVFTVSFVAGDPRTALRKPGSVVLTRSTAQKYFGQENPIGKTLTADNRRDWLVTGVVEDFPQQSHFHFDFLSSLSTYSNSRDDNWLSNNFHTYIVLRDDATAEQVQAKLPTLVRKYVGPQTQQLIGLSFDEMLASGASYGFFLQPLTSIHLHSDLDYELEPNGQATYVTLFVFIAIGILLIACINFMNLATARSANRAKEVGVRKTLGSSRQQLIKQFLAETIFITLLSVALAFVFVKIALPFFNAMTDKQFMLTGYGAPTMVLLGIGITVLVGLLAGSYPAFFLAAFQPVKVLKGNTPVSENRGTPLVRSTLVVFQFCISVILLVGTMVVQKQLNYVQNKKLGFNKEQVVVIKKTDDIGKQVYPFMDELRRDPAIISASNSGTLPGKPFNGNLHQLPGAGGEDNHLIFEMRADLDFFEAYQLEMAEGRYFSRNLSTDSTAVVINEAAARTFGFDDLKDREIIQYGRTAADAEHFKVIGVIKDFHFESLHQKIRPMAIKLFEKDRYGPFVSVRVNPADISETLAFIEKTWRKFAGAQAFEYVFFDQDFARLYESEMTTRRIMTLFAGLAIVIACLGLFGLASFIAEQRTREIGIRKILGASVGTIIVLLSRQFTRWVLLANVIAWPIAYFTMNSWLEDFAYRTKIGLESFLIAGIAALVVALMTVGYQTIRAALANPVEALRYE